MEIDDLAKNDGSRRSSLIVVDEVDPLNRMGNTNNSNLNSIRYYFASRNSTFEEIWNIAYRLSDEIGEQILDIFILTLIDHWDNEKERFVLLAERCLITLEYDFERLEIRQLYLYDYSRFDAIRIGTLCYPEISFNSILPHRSKLGMRFIWDSKKRLGSMDRWNPWSKEIPWITLTSHPLQYYIDQILLESQQQQQPPQPRDFNGFSNGIYCQNQCSSTSIHDDPYFTVEYLNQIKHRFSLEIFHNKLFEILNSFQLNRQAIPKLIFHETSSTSSVEPDPGTLADDVLIMGHSPYQSSTTVTQQLFELYHPDQNVTIVHYAPIVCENYFNLPATIFNRARMGYYRLRLF